MPRQRLLLKLDSELTAPNVAGWAYCVDLIKAPPLTLNLYYTRPAPTRLVPGLSLFPFCTRHSIEKLQLSVEFLFSTPQVYTPITFRRVQGKECELMLFFGLTIFASRE